MAHLVVTHATENSPPVGTLFGGLKFFVQRNVPAWKQLTTDINANGGHVVLRECDADFLICDHMKSNALGGSYSYTLIEAALKDGIMPVGEEMAAHATGALHTAKRPVGSVLPVKSTRNAFTAQDDRILWDWVKSAEAKGESVKGIAIYRPLAHDHPQHTVQSWRDRYVKHLANKPPPTIATLVVAANPPPSPPEEPDVSTEPQEPARKRRRVEHDKETVDMEQDDRLFDNFGQAEFDTLLNEAEDIEAIDNDFSEAAWKAWEDGHGAHSAKQWRLFYEMKVRPAYLNSQVAVSNEQMRDEGQSVSTEQEEGSQQQSAAAKEWSKEEDDVIIEGLHRGWNSAQIKDRLAQKRTVSAIRSRRIYLKKTFSAVEQELIQMGPHSSSGEELDEPAGVIRAADHLPTDSYFITSEANQAVEDQIQRESEASLYLTNFFDVQEVEETLPNSDAEPETQTQSESLAGDDESREHGHGPEEHAPGEHVADHGALGESHWSLEAKQAQEDSVRVDNLYGREQSPENQSRLETLAPQSYLLAPGVISDEHLHVGSPVEQDNLDQFDQSSVNSSDILRPELSRTAQLLPEKGFALTRANLATQQLQHRIQNSRGIDLEEDDPAMDQSPFISSLQDLLGIKQDDDSNTRKANGSTHPKDTQSSAPAPSDGEVDNVLRENLDWPSSPQGQPRMHSQALQSHATSSSNEYQASAEPNTAKGPFASMSSSHPNEFDFLLENESEPLKQNVYPDSLLAARQVHRPGDEEDDDEVVNELGGDAQYDSDDVDLTVPEPEEHDVFEIQHDETELHTVQHGQAPNLQTRASPRSSIHGGLTSSPAVDLLAHVVPRNGTRAENATTEVIELSSGNPSSSSYQSSQQSQLLPLESDVGEALGEHTVDTQDILNAETQGADLEMPLPPSSEADFNDDVRYEHRSPVQEGKQSVPEAESRPNDEEVTAMDIDIWINQMIVRGFNEDTVIAALKCTSMQTDLACIVLWEGKAGNGLPTNIAGIWGEQEDAWLEGSDAVMIKHLGEKHGADEVERRLQFLRDWRDEY